MIDVGYAGMGKPYCAGEVAMKAVGAGDRRQVGRGRGELLHAPLRIGEVEFCVLELLGRGGEDEHLAPEWSFDGDRPASGLWVILSAAGYAAVAA